MSRRSFGWAVAALLSALLLDAQAAGARDVATAYRIGWLGSGDTGGRSSALESFRLGMVRLGHVEGRTYVLQQRWWNGRDADLPGLIESLLAAKPNVIVAQGPTLNHGARNITQVPVVFNIASDPVSAGLARSLASPGGNLTGRTLMSLEINPKRLEFVHEALPGVTSLAVVYNTKHPGADKEMAANEAAARRLGLTLLSFHVQNVVDMEAALAALRNARAQAILVLPDGFLMQQRARIIEVATRDRLPVVSAWSAFARSGGLLTYGPNLDVSYGELAEYVDKILKGAKPADLPIQQPTRFELVVNLKTAKALGITVPPSILLRADEVIE